MKNKFYDTEEYIISDNTGNNFTLPLPQTVVINHDITKPFQASVVKCNKCKKEAYIGDCITYSGPKFNRHICNYCRETKEFKQVFDKYLGINTDTEEVLYGDDNE